MTSPKYYQLNRTVEDHEEWYSNSHYRRLLDKVSAAGWSKPHGTPHTPKASNCWGQHCRRLQIPLSITAAGGQILLVVPSLRPRGMSLSEKVRNKSEELTLATLSTIRSSSLSSWTLRQRWLSATPSRTTCLAYESSPLRHPCTRPSTCHTRAHAASAETHCSTYKMAANDKHRLIYKMGANEKHIARPTKWPTIVHHNGDFILRQNQWQ